MGWLTNAYDHEIIITMAEKVHHRCHSLWGTPVVLI